MGRISRKYKNWKNFLSEELWEIDHSQYSRFKASSIKQLKVILLTIQGIGEKDLNWKAVGLSFFTILSFIPFIAVILTITKTIGISDYFINLLYENFENIEVINLVIEISNNIINIANQGSYGLLSFLVFIWIVIWLMLSIEKVFNSIWKVEISSVIWKRFLTYIIILLLAPFVLILFLAASITVSKGVNSIDFFGSTNEIILWLLLFALVTAIFSAMYILIPSAKIRLWPAVKSAFIAAIAFTFIQYLYLETQVMVSRVNAVYGVFAAIPLFMVWLNIAWNIIISGAEISYALQNIEKK